MDGNPTRRTGITQSTWFCPSVLAGTDSALRSIDGIACDRIDVDVGHSAAGYAVVAGLLLSTGEHPELLQATTQ